MDAAALSGKALLMRKPKQPDPGKKVRRIARNVVGKVPSEKNRREVRSANPWPSFAVKKLSRLGRTTRGRVAAGTPLRP